MNEVSETESFSRVYERLELFEKEWIEGMKNQLRENLRAGDQLTFPWFREKRLKGKRLYYVVNFTTRKAVLVAFDQKKHQRKIMDFVLKNKDEFLSETN